MSQWHVWAIGRVPKYWWADERERQWDRGVWVIFSISLPGIFKQEYFCLTGEVEYSFCFILSDVTISSHMLSSRCSLHWLTLFSTRHVFGATLTGYDIFEFNDTRLQRWQETDILDPLSGLLLGMLPKTLLTQGTGSEDVKAFRIWFSLDNHFSSIPQKDGVMSMLHVNTKWYLVLNSTVWAFALGNFIHSYI